MVNELKGRPNPNWQWPTKQKCKRRKGKMNRLGYHCPVRQNQPEWEIWRSMRRSSTAHRITWICKLKKAWSNPVHRSQFKSKNELSWYNDMAQKWRLKVNICDQTKRGIPRRITRCTSLPVLFPFGDLTEEDLMLQKCQKDVCPVGAVAWKWNQTCVLLSPGHSGSDWKF